jgi:hypothetical protein
VTTPTLRAVPAAVEPIRLLDYLEVAVLLKCSRRDALRLMASDDIHTVRRGRQRFVRVDDFNRYVDSLDDR